MRYVIVSRKLDYLEIPWLKYCFFRLSVDFLDIEQYKNLRALAIPIFLVSQNSSQSLEDYFMLTDSLVRSRQTFGLIHISDEWYLRANYNRLYQGASFVFRNYFSPVLQLRNVFQLPLGADYDRLKHYSAKQYNYKHRSVLVHFSGQIKYSRIPMMEAMVGLSNNGCFPSFQSYTDYLQHMSNTRYALCPNGNTTPDTYRFYEALMLGCIPIVERGLGENYFLRLFGESCPIKSFSSWRMARAFIDELSERDAQLYADKVRIWWKSYLDRIPVDCHNFVLEHSTASDHVSSASLSLRFKAVVYLRHLIWLVALQSGYVLIFRSAKFLRSYLLGAQQLKV
jgi:hypothetical protein